MRKTSQHGFTLIEMVVTIIISGLFFAMTLGMIQPFLIEVPTAQTKENMETVREALIVYLEENGQMPCPASFTDAPDTANYGVASDCTAAPPAGVIQSNTGRVSADNTHMVRIGAVPIRTLDLPNGAGLDGWGNKMTYAVTEVLTLAGQYSNEKGGIFIRDAAGNEMTSLAGNVLYTLLSHGKDGKGSYTGIGSAYAGGCAGGDIDDENCDQDAIFVSTGLSEGSVKYDDLMYYTSFIGEVASPTCGNVGKIYAPAHPEADADNCLDPSYKHFSQDELDTTNTVSCGSSFAFCNGGWLDLTALTPGDYLVHWNAYLRFDYAQPSQYAVLEFEADGVTEQTQTMPFTGSICQATGLVQNESGLLEFDVDNDTTLRVRARFYGGDNNPPANGCGGNTPALNMLAVGQGVASSLKSISVDSFRKPQTF